MNVEALVVALEAMVLAIISGEFGDSVDFDLAVKRTRTFAREWVSGYCHTWDKGFVVESEWKPRVDTAMAKLEAEEQNRFERIQWAFSEEGDGEIAF